MKPIDLSRGFLSMTLGLAVVLAAAGAARADVSGPGDVPHSTLAPADGEIVRSLHTISELYVSAGEIAQKNGHSQAVRDYGATLINDHAMADQQLLAYAKKAGIDPNRMRNEPPPREMATYLQILDHMRTLHGPEFDRTFTATLRDAHSRTISRILTGMRDISDSDLNKLLDKQLPTLEKNYQTAASLATQLERPQQPSTTGTGQSPPAAPRPNP